MVKLSAALVDSRPSPPGATRLPFLPIATALILIVMLPLFIFKFPVMQDYPNHLARLYAIAFLGRDSLLAHYYAVHWRLIPDLAVDALVPWLARIVGIFAAGKLFVLGLLVLLPTGVVALNRALYGRFSLWPLVSCVFLYNGIFALGFLNYLFAATLALWAAACWIGLREKPVVWRVLVSSFFAIALFFSHLIGLAIYGLAIGSYELWRWHSDRPAPRVLARDMIALVLPFVLTLPLIFASPTAGAIAATEWQIWPAKPRGLYLIFRGYDGIAAAITIAATVATLSWGLWKQRLRVHPAGVLFAVVAGLFFLAMPSMLAGVQFTDQRLPVAFLFFLLGLSTWEWRSIGEERVFAAALFAFTAFIVTDVTADWAHDAPAIAEVEQSFAAIPPGSRVLAAIDTRNGEAPVRHAWQRLFHVPALVMIERSSLYSHAFTDPDKQPLAVKAPYRSATSLTGEFLKVGDLVRADREHARGRTDAADWWSDWRMDYDYLYVMTDHDRPQVPLRDLQVVAQGECFTLYRVGQSLSAR
jgi:hypothetical protein